MRLDNQANTIGDPKNGKSFRVVPFNPRIGCANSRILAIGNDGDNPTIYLDLGSLMGLSPYQNKCLRTFWIDSLPYYICAVTEDNIIADVLGAQMGPEE